MSDINDFQAQDIFFEDKEGNRLYRRDGVTYIVKDPNLKKALQELEGYRSFLEPRSLRFILILPVMFVLALFFWGLYLLGYRLDGYYAPSFYLLFFLTYGGIKYYYHYKIEQILKYCSVKKSSTPSPSDNQKIKGGNALSKSTRVSDVVPSSSESIDSSTPKVSSTSKVWCDDEVSLPKSWHERIKDIMPDWNFFHFIMFLLLGAPFFAFVYMIIYSSLVVE